MNSNWQDFLGTLGARSANALVTDFGDPGSELVSAREATIISPLLHLGLIECAGDDTKTFLHNQLTSDVNHLDPDAAQHSAWCSAKGRMLASFILYREGADYRALVSSDVQAVIQTRLQKYILRSKVNVSDVTGAHELIGLSGPQAETALQAAGWPAPSALLGKASHAHGTVIRLDSKRFILIVNRDAATGLWKILSSCARPAGTPVWQWLDVQAGIPLITETTTEAFVPQMANFDKIGGVSFHKGCYPGQEVVARTQYLGKIKRHLYRFHADTIVTAGMAIYAPEMPDAPCGMIANAAPAPNGGYDALAVVQEGSIENGDLRLDKPEGERITPELVAV